MVVGPIGTYFLTLNTLFKGTLAKLYEKHVTFGDIDMEGRKLYIRRRNGSYYGECGARGLRCCCYEGGPE